MNAVTQLVPTIDAVLDQHNRQGCFIMVMSEYRPDIARAIAHHYGLKFYDYREAVMTDLGWQAHTLELSELTQTLQDESKTTGIVAFNVESLLAAKDIDERALWFKESVQDERQHPVLVPIVVFDSDLDLEDETLQSRVINLKDYTLPEQTLISRLAM